MSQLRAFATRVRHAPVLAGLDPLWNALRRPYRRLLDPLGRGVSVRLGDRITVRMPSDFVDSPYEHFEPEGIGAVRDWFAAHPHGRLLDVGCAQGLYSLCALTASPQASVIAFDADLASVRTTCRMCGHAGVDRLRVVHGFIGDSVDSPATLPEAESLTRRALEQDGGAAGVTRYTCLADPHDGSIPTRTLDSLGLAESAVPLLLKCDVEGAELLVLRGAAALIERRSPSLLLSVHPALLPAYGHAPDDVRAFVEVRGYTVRVLAIDHEEHWWCVRA